MKQQQTHPDTVRLQAFAKLVEQMRHAQRQYFRHKSKRWLDLAKSREKDVDDECRDILQPQLFE